MNLLLLLALFVVSLLLLGRLTESVLNVMTALAVVGLCLLLLSANIQVSGAELGVPVRMQGLLTASAAVLGGAILTFVMRPYLARDDKLAKFRRPGSSPRLPQVPVLRSVRKTIPGTAKTSAPAKSVRSTITSEVSFQDYEVLERVGIGGMGSVYRARRHQDGRIVALKVPQEKYLADAKFVKRFYREAEVLKRFRHPNIVRVYDYRMQAPEHYIAMEFLDGESLEALLERQRFSFQESVQMLRALADALRHIHMQNVVHRDIKPANVMVLRDAFEHGKLREGGIKLMDFGIAVGKVLTRLTMTGARVGTPIYMAPEQAKGNRVDARSDVYSLGLLAYEMVTGETAFKGSYEAVVHQQVFEQPKPPKQVRLDVPGKLNDLILHMIEKDPVLRPTLDEIIARLDAGVLEDEVFSDPVALAACTDEQGGTLRLLDLSGKLRVSLRDRGKEASQLPATPQAVTGDAEGFLYIALPDYQLGSAEALIRKLDGQGRELLAFGRYGMRQGELLHPVSIAVGHDRIFVLDGETHFVNVFGPQGEFIQRFGGPGQGMGKFDRPTTLKIGADEQLYVLDWGNHEVQRFTLRGEYVSRYAFRRDRNSEQLRELEGLGVDQAGGVYIVDGVARKVRKIEADGTTGPTFTLDTLVGEPVDAPWLLEIDAEGRIYAVRQGGQMLRTFSPAGDVIRQRDMYAPLQALALVNRPLGGEMLTQRLPTEYRV